MKIIEGFKMRRMGNDYIVVAESSRLVNFNKMIVLNESAAYLWESVVGNEFGVDELKQLLMEKYVIDEVTAAADASKLVEAWQQAGLVAE